jgi:hypothetical protein
MVKRVFWLPSMILRAAMTDLADLEASAVGGEVGGRGLAVALAGVGRAGDLEPAAGIEVGRDSLGGGLGARQGHARGENRGDEGQ